MAPTNTEKLAEHARQQRDHFADEALKAVESTETRAAGTLGPEPLFAEADKWNERYERFKAQGVARRERLEVKREPLTYQHRYSKHSYFKDRAMVEINNDAAAEERLQRHGREMEVEVPRLEKRLAGEPEGMERRVNPTRTDGQGGYFSPPLWAIEYFATGRRPKRVLSAMIENFLLEPGVSEIKLPALAPATKTEEDIDGTPVEDKDLVDNLVESWVTTTDGMQDISMQLLEQSAAPGMDFAILKDLHESYDQRIEERLIVGKGKEFQEMLGLLNLPTTGTFAASKQEYTASSPSGVEMFRELGKVAAKLGDKRDMPPEVWLMRTARWAWLGSAQDLSGLPLAVPGHQPVPLYPHLMDDEVPTSVPPLLGWPIYCDDAIPTEEGVGKNQDVIISIRPSDQMIFEGVEKTRVMTDVTSGTLQARIQLWRYGAVLWRYPQGISTLQGSGLVVESGW